MGEGEPPEPGSPEWLRQADRLLTALTAVVSARVVVGPTGEIEEIHVLATDEATPKQTVRNVQSALMAQLGTRVDRRKISVAPLDPGAGRRQTVWTVPQGEADQPEAEPGVQIVSGASTQPVASGEAAPVPGEPTAPTRGGHRILFLGHGVDSVRSQRLRLKVALDWKGRRFVGESATADVLRSRMEGFASATLRALDRALDPTGEPDVAASVLSLEGVRSIKAFDRQFVVVAVSAYLGGQHTALTGAAAVSDSLDRAVILATLQATDRRVRAFLDEVNGPGNPSAPGSNDPFEGWE